MAKNYKNIPEITLKYKSGNIEKTKIVSSQDSYKVLKKMFDSDTLEIFEQMIIVFLNNANKTIGWTKHSSGGTAMVVCDPKLILTTALQCGATKLIIAHNHPSGELNPSKADLIMSNRVKEGCNFIGMELLDSLIITAENYYSMADEGDLIND